VKQDDIDQRSHCRPSSVTRYRCVCLHWRQDDPVSVVFTGSV